MLIRQISTGFPESQPNIWHAFNRMWGEPCQHIWPYVQKIREVVLDELSTFWQLPQAAIEVPYLVSNEQKQIFGNLIILPWVFSGLCCVSSYRFGLYLESLASAQGPSDRLSEALDDAYISTDRPGEHEATEILWLKGDTRIRQPQEVKTTKNPGGETLFSLTHTPTVSPKDPTTFSARWFPVYFVLPPEVLRSANTTRSPEYRVKRFVDVICLECDDCNHRTTDCLARKNTQTFRAAGGQDTEVAMN